MRQDLNDTGSTSLARCLARCGAVRRRYRGLVLYSFGGMLMLWMRVISQVLFYGAELCKIVFIRKDLAGNGAPAAIARYGRDILTLRLYESP